jgi:hypothetical protein
MTDASDPIGRLNDRLPRHAAVLDSLRQIVEANDQLRWLELGCSLGAGGGDEDSDLDVGIGYAGSMTTEQLGDLGESVAVAVGPTVGMLAHRMDGWPSETCRMAVEYAIGVQLDLVFLPAEWREGKPDRSVAVVDKDGRLQTDWVPPSRQPPEPGLAREWMFLGWWAISNAAKYLKRCSLFEATEALAEARKHALQLFAASRQVPYPAFGLVSLLDFPPFDLPQNLASTYCDPSDLSAVISAANACVNFLEQACVDASEQLGVGLLAPLAGLARRRLVEATANTRSKS